MRPLVISICLLLSAVAAGCSQAVEIPLLQPSATATQTSTPTPTPTATFTPTPTPTPTPIPAARIETGEHALVNGDWDGAVSEFEAARQASRDPEIQTAALLGLGRTRLFSGNPEGAVEILASLVNGYPNSPHLAEAQFFLGQAYNDLGRYYESADAYLNYLALRPGVIDAHIFELRGDALFAAGDYAGAANDFRAALNSPSLLDGIDLELKVARALSVSGDTAGALAMYDDLYYRTTNDKTRALIDLRKGQILTSLGQWEQAQQAYLDAVYNYPTAYESYSALVALVDAGVPVNELSRGIVDYYAGEYGVALAALDRYLQDAPQDPASARYFMGLATMRLGGYQGAVAEFDRVIQNFPDHPYWDDAYEQKAYLQWAYLDQYTLAVQTLLEFVAAVPAHPRAGEFLFDAAQVAERSGELQQAAQLWTRVYDEYPAYELAQRAIFLAGVARYRLGDFTGAYTTFQHGLTTATSLNDRAAAFLWIGKTQMAQGQAEVAKATWQQGAAIDPTGYYSERARDLALDRAPFAPPQAFDMAVDWAKERKEAEDWMRRTFLLETPTDLSGPGPLGGEPGLVRGTELWRLGMWSEARMEFEKLRRDFQTDPVQSFRLAGYLHDLGVHRSAILAARQVLDMAGMDDAATMVAPAYFNHIRFGTYFSDLILPVAQEYNFHPLFLFSVVRQESLFESFVSSSAAANGLMQIIPSTGESIARNLGWPPDYTTSDLYRPVVNVRLGTDYMDSQLKSFEGDIYAALAAYNGGPGNSRAWKKLAPDDPDVFLEVIRFSETRNYIRGIYEIFSIYRRIYDRTP